MQYIRRLKWCQCEQSCNVFSGRLEKGLSVYEAKQTTDGWVPTGHAWFKNQAQVEGAGGPWFLVEGKPLEDRGGDGEPLVTAVTARALLSWQDGILRVAGAPGETFSNHPAYPQCKCEDNLEAYSRIQQEGPISQLVRKEDVLAVLVGLYGQDGLAEAVGGIDVADLALPNEVHFLQSIARILQVLLGAEGSGGDALANLVKDSRMAYALFPSSDHSKLNELVRLVGNLSNP